MLNNTGEQQFQHVHQIVVDNVKRVLPGEEQLCNLAELFRIFADTTRIKILYALTESEMCVYDIALLLGMGQSAISHQLRVLKQSRLVKSRRKGKNILYSLADEHVNAIIKKGMEHTEE